MLQRNLRLKLEIFIFEFVVDKKVQNSKLKKDFRSLSIKQNFAEIYLKFKYK